MLIYTRSNCSIFLFETDCVFPKPLISFTRLLLFTVQEWEKTRDKEKLPKAKPDTEVYSVAELLVENLLGRYPTSLKVIINIFYCNY